MTTLPLGARRRPRGVYEDDWSARPTAERPWPVILIHGTCDNKGIWQVLADMLRAAGWATFAPDYGMRATGPLQDSARQLDAYIDAVRTVTGAEQVILVGHSQGGLLARYWMRMHESAEIVRHVVCISAPNHGTTQGGIASPLFRSERQEEVARSLIDGWFGPAGMQQVTGSEIVEATNRGSEVEPGVSYTCIATRSDAIVVPPNTCFLDGANVHNVYIQDIERLAIIRHEDMPMDRRVCQFVLEELERL
ncbi:triacylglycerol lipase [uncultured Corynebacterium sp.]|uniref:esterase/lipase family protein n=1 Tax=uncultured Corynebacterium sp. TaxID=159447 RepID=UPI00288937F4|nr:triacylglycerol lipase [uncultured Corynebacterium sp.]